MKQHVDGLVEMLPMKPFLCKAGETLREQINARYPSRDKASDGWIADARHNSAGNSDHIPAANDGFVVRAIDIDKDLSGRPKPDIMPYLADQLRECAKLDGRISYLIFNARIASSKKGWAWRPYKGFSDHKHHLHISFTPKGDTDGKKFAIPLLEG
jgi:hypothetical protein